MKNLIETTIAVIYSSALIFGAGHGLKSFHDTVKEAALSKITQGLSSSEELANSLTGEKTSF